MTASVSTLIPCYRCSDTIGRAVDSVAKQTLQPAEVILVDDGSGDTTLEVLLQLQRDYGKDWIKVIALKNNGGSSVARNTAWEFASHDYIAFLDADEVWHPEKIAVQYSWMTCYPDLALSGHESVRIKPGDQVNPNPIPKDIKASFVSRNQILLFNMFSTAGVIIKRNLKQRFNPSLKTGEDYFLWLEIILGGSKAAAINCPLAYSFKAFFGESGLSENIWEMEENELRIYQMLWKYGYITLVEFRLLSIWSLAKYYRRYSICSLRVLKRKIFYESEI